MERNVNGIKKCPIKFQNIMNNILIPYSKFAVIYLDDVLIFFLIKEHLKP